LLIGDAGVTLETGLTTLDAVGTETGVTFETTETTVTTVTGEMTLSSTGVLTLTALTGEMTESVESITSSDERSESSLIVLSDEFGLLFFESLFKPGTVTFPISNDSAWS
jgi:hypothetical protein